MKEKVLLTKEKKEELEKELKHLEEKEKTEVMESLEQARREDVSEDAEGLSLVLQIKAELERKVEDIKELLSNSKIIKKQACDPTKINIGSEIKVDFKGKKTTMKIVSSVEADPLKNYISNESPLGKALMKAKLGDTVKLKVDGNTIEYKVLEVC
ncbi:MAG TPA: GreA/GreB family elongation factor [Candidatus Dojkabacteria bacterium]|nr:GreA/GreB family elongation factor [Candidatus Dojkabacteria bacterium]